MPAVRGIDFLVKVNTGTVQTPVWTTIGGQRNATLNLGGADVDVTSKDGNDWEEVLPGLRNWSLDFDGLWIENDTALEALETAFFGNQTVQIELTTHSGAIYAGYALVRLKYSAPMEEATISGTFRGTGPLTKTP